MAPVRGLSSIKEVRESLDRQFHNDVNRLTYSKVSFLPIHDSTSSKMSKRLYASLLTFGWLKSAAVCILCALFSPSLQKPNVRLMWSIGSKRFFCSQNSSSLSTSTSSRIRTETCTCSTSASTSYAHWRTNSTLFWTGPILTSWMTILNRDNQNGWWIWR